jgi:hypothetical protein
MRFWYPDPRGWTWVPGHVFWENLAFHFTGFPFIFDAFQPTYPREMPENNRPNGGRIAFRGISTQTIHGTAFSSFSPFDGVSTKKQAA